MSNPLIQPKRRFARNADPLRRPSRPVIKKPAVGKPTATKQKLLPNSQPSTSILASAIVAGSDSLKPSDKTQYREYNLNACNEDDIKDLRYHLMRFHSKTEVNPVGTFTKPIRLHRKDPRNMQNQLTLAELEERNKRLGITTSIPKHLLAEAAAAETKANSGDENIKTENGEPKTSDTANGKDDAKQKGKTTSEEADMSLIAPDGGARRGKSHLFQKKTKQVVLGDANARKLRYEEYYPWILEDFDGKNTWVGNYEAGQTDAYVLFVFDNDGFKMVPAEKWYKMTPRNKYATLTSEEAEKQMEKGELPNRWVMKYFGNEEGATTKHPTNMRRRFRTTDSNTVDEMRRDDDGNDIDFDEEFADDEEAPIMEGNEDEVKEVENKIKKEHQSAKISALFDEQENEEEDEENRKVDKQGKHMIKYLRSREKNINYETDDDSNPYATEESSEEEEEIDNPASLGGAIKGPNGTEIKKEPGTEAIKTESVTIKTEEGAEGTPAASVPGEEKPKKKLKDKKLKEKKKKKGLKKHHNLPRGMVILNLPPAKLAQFQSDLWNPGLKRRRAELSDGEESGVKHKVKKLKTKDKSNAGGANKNTATATQASVHPTNSLVNNPAAANTAAAAPSTTNGQSTSPGNRLSTSPAASAAEGSPSPVSGSTASNQVDLITEEEVKQVVRSQRLNAREILAVFKNRYRKKPENLKLLMQHLKHVAKINEGYLVLRDNV